MFALAVNNLTELKALTPSVLFDGMPVSVTIDNAKELYIWWEGASWADDGQLFIELNAPNTNLGRFKKVFNKSISSPSIPFGNPTPEQVGTYWLDTSFLAVYLACSFIVNEVRQYKWIRLVNNTGSK